MIPVEMQAEPAGFDAKVRQKGRKWLAGKGIGLDAAPAKAADLPPYWREFNLQLWESYSGVCAYLAIFFEWSSGAGSTDHFVAKSQRAGDAYEWGNYRLACQAMNRNKGCFDDVLDPVCLAPDVFFLNLGSGKIRVNPGLDAALASDARKTIARLRLNSDENAKMRSRHYQMYLEHRHGATLKALSPFVWQEAQRQGLLV